MPVDDVVNSTAPETPVSTPEAVSTPVETPVTPAAPVDSEQAMRDAVGNVMNKVPGFELDKPEVKTPEQEAAEKAKTEAEKPLVEQPKTEEEKAAEAKAAEDAKADEVKAEPNPLDQLGPLPVETLAKAITENPELAAALEKAGLEPELLYETSRRAALSDQFTEIFPTPDAAKFADQSANHFYDIEEGFPKIQNVTDLDGFITKTMLPLSILKDGQGQPLMNPDGSYQTDGSIARFFDTTSQFETIMATKKADELIASYSKVPGEEGERMLGEAERLKEALTLAQSFRDNGYKLPGQKPAAGQRSAEDQALIDRLQKQNEGTQKLTTEARQKEAEAFQSGVFTDVTSAVTPLVQGVLDRTSLNSNEKRFIAEKAYAETWDALAKNRHFQQQKEHLYSLGNTPENRQSLVALTKTTFNIQATKVLQRLVTESGGKQISASKAKQEKIDTQITNDRMNQGTGTTPAAKSAPVLTSAQTREQAIANYKARNNGATPEDGDIIAETMAIRSLNRSA